MPNWNRESEVQATFCAWLEREGWTDIMQARGREYLDVGAVKHGRKLYAEVKGETSDPGIDADIMFGNSCAGWTSLMRTTQPLSPRASPWTGRCAFQAGSGQDSTDIYVIDQGGNVRLIHPNAG